MNGPSEFKMEKRHGGEKAKVKLKAYNLVQRKYIWPPILIQVLDSKIMKIGDHSGVFNSLY